MLTDLSFLAPGQQWPPQSELQRLMDYEKNRQLFENEHASVYAEPLSRIRRVIGNFEDVIDFTVVVNYQKLITLKLADYASNTA